jgi:hypothetical protein
LGRFGPDFGVEIVMTPRRQLVHNSSKLGGVQNLRFPPILGEVNMIVPPIEKKTSLSLEEIPTLSLSITVTLGPSIIMLQLLHHLHPVFQQPQLLYLCWYTTSNKIPVL